jgi:hypothetical protein
VPHSLLSHPIEGSKPSAKIADAMAYPYIAPEVTLIGGLMTAELPPYMNAYGNIVVTCSLKKAPEIGGEF